MLFAATLHNHLRQCSTQRNSNVAGIQHHTARCAEGLRWDVLCELCTNNTTVSVRSTNLPPHHAKIGTVDLLLRFVHVRHAFSAVERGLLARPHVVQLQQSAIAIGVGLAPLVSEDGSLDVETCDALLRCGALVLESTCLLRHRFEDSLVVQGAWLNRTSH